jgi:hypothetical protein
MRRLLQLVVPCVLLSGCFGPGEGVEVPQDEIYFPVGLALDRSAKHLLVVDSDFDLQYNGGAVQSFDLDALGGKLYDANSPDDPCGAQGDRSDSDRLLFPGRCNPIDPTDRKLLIDHVKIGAFATDAVLRAKTDEAGAPQRLFVPVRGDSTLHWLEIGGDGKIECGQQSAGGACDSEHRAGDDPKDNTRDITLNAEPFGVDATQHGERIVVTNQTTGTASLFVNDWVSAPKLKFALSSSSIPQRPIGIVAVPPPLVAIDPQQPAPPPVGDTFMMTFRNSAQVRLVRYAPDVASSPLRDYLVDGGGVAIDANSVGSDSRGIALDSLARRKAEQRCASDDAVCLNAAALVPLDVYVANRAPATLLIGRTRPPQEYPYFFQTVPLTTGPSRVVVGDVLTPSGDLETRVFAICFDSRRIFVYDPQRSRVEAEILTGRGPHAVAVDTARKRLYVGHFTDSYIGVYSLDLAVPATYGTMLGTLGTPKSPRSSK